MKYNTKVAERLSARLQQRSDYLVFVGVPLDRPARWVAATSYSATEVITAEGRFDVGSIRAFVIAYPNHQILDVEARGLAVPAELGALHPAATENTTHVDLAAAQAGLRRVDVSYADRRAGGRYRTTLRNLTTEPIRVVWFGGFVEVDGGFVLSTVTGNVYSADEFIAWYAAPRDGWIAPGAEVSDPDNYGAPPVLWAYQCETKSGSFFVTGRVLTAP